MASFLNRVVSILVFAAYFALLAAGVWVAVEKGVVTAYIAFALLNPLSTALWFRFEGEPFFAPNLPFIYTLLTTGFLLGVVCPLLITMVAWRNVSPLAWVGILAASLLHSLPFLMYAVLHVSFYSARRNGRRK